jgi:osmoprotectant transport system ATP-binding protein
VHSAPLYSEIEFRGVSLRRGETPVLRGFDLTVFRGETVALVGRSGAGKSTVLKLINRLLVPDEGQVFVAGKATTDWDPFALRRRLGYVLQEVGLFPHMSVAQNVGIVPRLLDWSDSDTSTRTGELLDLVGLPSSDFGPRSPAQLGRWIPSRAASSIMSFDGSRTGCARRS